MTDGLRARYDSEDGARAYAGKYDRSVARRLSHRREMRLLRWALHVARGSGSDAGGGKAGGGGGGAGTVLDVPCAAGRLVPVLLETADRVTAIDRSPAMVGVAKAALSKEIAGGRVLVGEGDAASLPFGAGAFDTVVCWRLLHHLTNRDDRVAILRELGRTARRAVVVTFADSTSLKARLQLLRGRNRRCAKLSPAELSREAADAGLEVVDVKRLSSPFSLLAAAGLRPAARGAT